MFKIIRVNKTTHPDKSWSPTNWPPLAEYIGDDQPAINDQWIQQRRYEHDINEEGGETNIRT